MTEKSTSNKVRRAIFAGSFNPFTTGHYSIVERGLALFDEIIIALGINADKPTDTAQENAQAINALYSNEPRVKVVIWQGLTVDLAKKEKAEFFLRGVRNSTDFEYEKNMADINRKISGIETVLIPTLPELSSVTSTVVRELKSYGRDVTEFLPN